MFLDTLCLTKRTLVIRIACRVVNWSFVNIQRRQQCAPPVT